MRKSARAVVVSATLFGASTAGCFALFGLDGYGPPAVDVEEDAALDAGDASAPEARADAPVDAGGSAKVVFVTSGRFNGAFGGLDGADERCQESAERAGYVERTFKAWLSDANASPSARFARFGADAGPPIVLADGRLVAEGFAELAESGPRVPIQLTELRTSVNDDGSGPSCAGVGLVWSNTRPDGSARGTSSCNGWTSVEAVGRLGSSSSVQDGRWTDECLSSCSQEARLYCFEQ